MRFLADQDIYQTTIDFLKSLGFEVVRVKDIGLSRGLDEELLHYAFKEGLVMLTRDKDFGALIFLRHFENNGVILLRCEPVTINDVHAEFGRFLRAHEGMNFRDCFVVIEPNRHRIRHRVKRTEIK